MVDADQPGARGHAAAIGACGRVYLWPWIWTACWKVGRLTQGMCGWVIAPTALKPILSCSAWVWPP